MVNANQSRTDWAERQVEDFLSMPFVSEFVFRSVRKNDPTEKEVIDFLVMNGLSGILVSQKTQDDPEKRSVEKNESWVRGNAKAAFRQIGGALRPQRRRPSWCVHPRRGRVDFDEGLPPITHAIVIVETRQAVDLQNESSELPLRHLGVPISYLSSNDFLNLVVLLGTVPDLVSYLDARCALPFPCLRVVGDEKCLLEYYLLHQGSFSGCISHADAKIVAAARRAELDAIVAANSEDDYFCSAVAYFAHSLSKRDENYTIGISPELLAAFDPADSRANYLRMQQVISSLMRWERAALGRALLGACESLSENAQGFVYRSLHFDSCEWVFVLGASKNVVRSELLPRIAPLMRGAMACYRKQHCMVVIDRDGASFEIGLSRAGVQLTPADHIVGERLFGHLRTASFAGAAFGSRGPR